MAKAKKINQTGDKPIPRWESQTAFARRVGVSVPRVSAMIKAGHLSINARKQVNVSAGIEYFRGREDVRVSTDPDDVDDFDGGYTSSRTVHEKYKAKKARLEYLNLKGELIPRSEVIEAAAKIITTAKGRLLTVPGKLAPLLAGEENIKKIKSIIESEISQALDYLARLEEL